MARSGGAGRHDTDSTNCSTRPLCAVSPLQALVFSVQGPVSPVQALVFPVLAAAFSVQALVFSVQAAVFSVQGPVSPVQALVCAARHASELGHHEGSARARRTFDWHAVNVGLAGRECGTRGS
ncbi:hypothetical protein Atai01_59030 [Amycolatopsis taiwanensis]|uniref:Uncharacterized protein n=1 Tax=Amycolatopsis taiwanensis TaxID=342230 RepID=A0A9W6R549_9PSEU|nr:hypothetical protein Atai01_59030 [Amycolatopsis taiwanensis]